MSIFGSLGIGVRGLGAAQLALNVLGQNVSNANTEGYSRKRVDLSADTRSDDRFGEMGSGVEIERVSRIYDEFLEIQIRKELTEQGVFTSMDTGLERIENILTEPSDAGLNEAMDKFWASWQDLANNPEDPASRDVVRSTAFVLQDKFHTLARQFEELRNSQDGDIEGRVNEINGTAKEIFGLNEEVAVMELRGGMANDSRDRRDFLVQKLSKMIDVDTVEDDSGRITLTTAGNVLVGPATVIRLNLARETVLTEDGDKTAEAYIQFENSQKRYEPRGGELRGVFDLRDEVIPRFEGFINQLTETFVSQVNQLHNTGYNLNGNTGVNFFDPTKTRADNIMVSAAVAETGHNIAAASGGTTVGPIKTLAPFGTTIPNPLVSRELDLKTLNPKYKDLVSGTVEITMGPEVLQEGAGRDFVVNYDAGTVTFLNYNHFSGGEPIDIEFRYNSSGFSGPGDGSNALSIAQLRDAFTMGEDMHGNPIKTIGEFYSGFIGVLGIERNQAKSNVETRAYMVDQFSSRKAEISGVSLDEELGDMIKFEHSYQASARYISTINQLLETLMNL